MGTSGALAGPNFQITAGMGRQIGPNLFHSFGTFNLVNGETATFSGPANIQNILARVTGGSPSSIDGTITSTIAGANLFLLNPSGVMFGPNAQVNITGAFVAGTPDDVKLAGGGIFYTSLGGPSDNLTSAPISAFGFLAAAPAPVSFDGAQFVSGTGTGIHVIGGGVTLDNGATLFQPAGVVSIFSAASAGEVPFALASPVAGFASATNPRLGNITVQNSSAVAVAGTGGGKVVIRGGRLTVDGGFVTAVNAGAGPGPDVSVQVNHLAVQNNGLIRSVAVGSGPGGNVAIAADDVSIVGGSGETGIVNSTAADGRGGNLTIIVTGGISVTQFGAIGQSASGTGAAGDITIQAGSLTLADGAISLAAADAGNAGSLSLTVTGAVTLNGGSFIDATAFSSGNAGDISVHAGSMSIDGTGAAPNGNLGIFAESEGSGNAGTIVLNIDGALVVMAGGEIDSSTFFNGAGGNIAIHAGTLSLVGSSDPVYATFIGATSVSGGSANAGTITVNVDGAMSVTSGAEISGTTATSGNGGDLFVHAGTLLLDGSLTPTTFTGIISTTNAFAPGAGRGGSLTVNVDGSLSIGGHAEIASGTFSTGNSGDVTVNAGALKILGGAGAGNPSGIYAQTGSSGQAGLVAVNVAGGIVMAGLAEIDTSTFLSGRAGDVIVRGQSLSVDGSGSPVGLSGIGSTAAPTASGPAGSVNVGITGALALTNGGVISSANHGTGPGGSVLVSGGNIALMGGSAISASAVAADAGTVGVTAAEVLSLMNGSSIDTTAGANGGNITLAAGQLIYLLESQITAQAGLNGGNIDMGIDPQFVVLNRSRISANAAFGQGGNITITSRDYLNTNTAITATGTTNGSIIISSPDLDLSGSLIALPANLVSDQDRLQEKCARAVNHEFSTFIVVGRGGTEAAAEEYQADFGLGYDRVMP